MPAESLGFAFADEALESRVRAGLEAVELALRDSARSEAPFVTEAAQHVMVAGGKRFRPLLVLLAAEFGPSPAAAEVVDSAVVVELTHVATLYHDDVMDEAALRRGASTANARWDNSVAILTGDWLFARASDLVASLGPEAVRIQARTFGRLVEGQIRETLGVIEGQDPLADRDLGSLRGPVRRCVRRDPGNPAGLRRGDRRRLPTRRRHPRRHLR